MSGTWLAACLLAGCAPWSTDGFDGYESARRPGRARIDAEQPEAQAPDAAADGDSAAAISDEAEATSTPTPATTPVFAELGNARDLGGVPLGHGTRMRSDALFRGPPLASLSPGACEEFSTRGIRTVIDLRVPAETAATPESACITDQARIVLAPLPIPYNVDTTDYIEVLDTRESIAAVFRVLGDDEAYPIYFHCTLGRDRTGILTAVILLALGASREVILDEYSLSANTVGAYPRALDGALDELERRGGIAAYLAAVGVSDDQLATLRARTTIVN